MTEYQGYLSNLFMVSMLLVTGLGLGVTMFLLFSGRVMGGCLALWTVFAFSVGATAFALFAPLGYHEAAGAAVNRAAIFLTSHISCGRLEEGLVRWQLERKRKLLPAYEERLISYNRLNTPDNGDWNRDIMNVMRLEEFNRNRAPWGRNDLAAQGTTMAALERCHLPVDGYLQTIERLMFHNDWLSQAIAEKKAEHDAAVLRAAEERESKRKRQDAEFQEELRLQRLGSR